MTETQRKKLIVDKPVQGALIRRLVIHWLSFGILCFVLAAILNWLSDPRQHVSQLATQVWNYYGPFFLLLLVLIPLFIMDTVKLSHRFAGPIMRFRRAIQDLASGGSPERITFREKDFWHDVADGFNLVIDKIESLEAGSANRPSATNTGSKQVGPENPASSESVATSR